MEISNLSDARIIEFFAKSPIKSFGTMLDVLNYLDGAWIQEGIEYELFDWALGDNDEQVIRLRVPSIGGIPANALFRLTRVLQDFHFVRRRILPSDFRRDDTSAEEPVAFYSLTNTGRKLRFLLEQIDKAKKNVDLHVQDESDME